MLSGVGDGLPCHLEAQELGHRRHRDLLGPGPYVDVILPGYLVGERGDGLGQALPADGGPAEIPDQGPYQLGSPGPGTLDVRQLLADRLEVASREELLGHVDL